jgi:hypothetical protein
VGEGEELLALVQGGAVFLALALLSFVSSWWDGGGWGGGLREAPLAGLPQEDQVGDDLLRDVQVDDPVHQVEADEADGEENAAVLVNVGGGDAAHLLQVLLAVEQGRPPTPAAGPRLMQHQLIVGGTGRGGPAPRQQAGRRAGEAAAGAARPAHAGAAAAAAS